MDRESSSPLLSSLPRSYDDESVLQLEPLRDSFLARELELARFSRTQEIAWVVDVAKGVRDNGPAVCAYLISHSHHSPPPSTFFKTEVVNRWLRAISLSTKPEFRNFHPPLTDEVFKLFVQFFWSIKMGDPSTANQLLHDARRYQWGLEPSFSHLTFNRFLESGDGLAVSAAGGSESAWARYPASQAVHLKGKSRKTLNAVGRKRNNRPFSSAITKRRVTAQSHFKKRRLSPRARLAPDATVFPTSQDERMVVDKGK